jgi:hypothetical protein
VSTNESKGAENPMSQKMKEKNKTRTQIKDLTRDEKELSADEKKKIQGGADRLVGGGIRSTSANSVPFDSSK